MHYLGCNWPLFIVEMMRSEHEMEMMRGRLGRLFRNLAYELRMNAKASREPTEPVTPVKRVDYTAVPPAVSSRLQQKLAVIAAENESCE